MKVVDTGTLGLSCIEASPVLKLPESPQYENCIEFIRNQTDFHFP